jgi:hypothetical protein
VQENSEASTSANFDVIPISGSHQMRVGIIVGILSAIPLEAAPLLETWLPPSI